LEAETGVKPRCPKGRAPARGLDARLCLQHPFMRAGDASPKAQSKNFLDSDHNIYRDHEQAQREAGRSGLVESIGRDHVFKSVEEAVRKLGPGSRAEA
jgi:hypothetical protein